MPRSHVRDLTGRNVFVTGAASGIGRATALLAARRGARLHLTDIRATALAEVAEEIRASGGRVHFAEAADLADHAAVRALAERLTAGHGSMDVVMNIAGISTWGTVSSLEHEHWQRMVDVNLMGPIHVIEYLVPAMIDGGRGGHLVNVSSAAGLIGLPWHAAYSAAKFGLRGVSEVLRFDLRRHRIGVSLVCPGAVDTPLTETVDIVGVDRDAPLFRRLQARFRRSAATPEEVAQAILEGVRTGRYLVHTSREIQAVHFLQRVFPPAYELLMRLLNSLAHRALPSVAQARAATAQGLTAPPPRAAGETAVATGSGKARTGKGETR